MNRSALGTALLTLASFASIARAQEAPPGYDDTPFLPDSPWRVHDSRRPPPPVVTPGPPAAPAPPPSDAIVLFGGKDLAAWTGEGGGAARWKLVDGAFEVNGTGTIRTRERFGDCQLHLEWQAPAAATESSQARGNSGVFLMGRYEVQILDSFENRTYADGQASALYGQWPPLANACRRPGQWQSYDIAFRAPRFEGGALKVPARVTVLHNGVLVHDARPFFGPTTHRKLPDPAPHEEEGPLALQDHGDPVRFRNVWIRRLPREGA